MEKKNIGYYSSPLENGIIREERREKIEILAFSRLTSREQEVLDLRYGFTGDAHTVNETAEILGVVYETIRATENRALCKLRSIILGTEQFEIVDSEIGMSKDDLYNIAKNIARPIFRTYCLANREQYYGMLTQYIQDIILWKLSSEERKILLFYSGKYSLFPKSKRTDLIITFERIKEKIERLVLEDTLVCEKTKIKVKV